MSDETIFNWNGNQESFRNIDSHKLATNLSPASIATKQWMTSQLGGVCYVWLADKMKKHWITCYVWSDTLTTSVFSCRVSTVSKAKIMTNSEMYIKSGNDINLTCVTMQAPSPPLFIYWYKNGNIINYAQRGGINIITERQSKTSKLIIDRATAKDSGNYTCSPSDSGECPKLELQMRHYNSHWPHHWSCLLLGSSLSCPIPLIHRARQRDCSCHPRRE